MRVLLESSDASQNDRGASNQPFRQDQHNHLSAGKPMRLSMCSVEFVLFAWLKASFVAVRHGSVGFIHRCRSCNYRRLNV